VNLLASRPGTADGATSGVDGGHRSPPSPDAPAGRPPAGALASAALLLTAAFAALAAAVAGGRTPTGVDRRLGDVVTNLVPDGPHRLLDAVADLGSPLVLLVAVAAFAWWARGRGDRRLTLIALTGPIAAVALAELVAKPLIDRRIGVAYNFPSGHTTSVAALATLAVIATAWQRPTRRRLVATTVIGLAATGAVAVAVVRLGWHVATDTIGALALGPAVVLAVTALVLAWSPAPRTTPVLGRGGKVGLALGGVALAGVSAIQLPLLELSPGPVIDLNRAITVDGEPASLHGAYRGLTVRERTLTIAGWAWHQLSESPNEVVPRSAVIPPGVDAHDYAVAQQRVFADAGQVAAAVAERALGQAVSVSGEGAGVTAVQPGSPADGHLAVGDVITRVDDRAVGTVDDLRAAIAAAAAADDGRDTNGDGGDGTVVTLAVRATDGTDRTETLTLAPLAGTGQPGIGVGAGTVAIKVTLPTPVAVDGGDIGGPSAGLMTALATYDALSPDDVARGKAIAGTGTIDLDGTVGPIGGIEEKVRAAIGSDADLFLAPADQAAAARDAADGRITVVGVANFDEALAALRSTPTAA
jgi:PDZ domain-containing protein